MKAVAFGIKLATGNESHRRASDLASDWTFIVDTCQLAQAFHSIAIAHRTTYRHASTRC